MSKKLKVDLIANTSQFKRAMSETSNQMKLINSEFKSAAAETDKYGNKLDATSAKKKQLSGVIDQYKQRVKAIKDEQKHWRVELEKGNITEEEHAQKQQDLARRLNNTEGEMKRYEGQLKRLNAEGKNARMTFDEFDKKFRDVGRTMRNVGAQVGITAGIGFMGLKRVLTDVVTEAKDFYFQMSEVQAISGATADEMKILTDQSKELGRETKFTAQEAAESQANLARAGFNVNEIYGAMPGLLDLAASSNLDLGTSANITSNIIRTFNYDAKEAGRVADVLAKGAATANTDVQGLGQAMEVAGPVANSLDIALEQVAASAGIMADAGIDGSKSGRMLRQGMLRLAKPVGDAEKLLKKMGINAFDADGNMKSLDKVVGELEKGLKGQTKQQKAAALATIFGSESTAGWTVLLDKGADALKDYTKELEDSEGAAKEMADVMQDNAEGAIIRMQSALSGLKIELGEKLLPVIAKGADFIGDLATKLAEMDEETISTIAELALLATGVLGVTTAVAGVVTAIGALMAFAGPVGLAITVGTALFAGLAAVIYRNQKRTKALKEEQEKAKTEALRYGENLSEGTKKGVKGYTDLYEGAKLKMYELRNMSGEEAKKTSAEIVKAFSQMADAVIAELEVQREKLTGAINDVYAIAGEAGKDAAKDMTNEVIKKFDKDIAEYKGALDVVKEAHDKYSNDISKMPGEFAHKYQEALKVLEGGSRAFAKTQDEMFRIQKGISDKQGKILYDEAASYSKRINDTYEESLKAANDWYVEKQSTFEQALAQGKITHDQYDALMLGTQSRTNEMMAVAATEYEKSNKLLADNLDKRGKLIDLKIGEEFERHESYVITSEGYYKKAMESQEEYLARWVKHAEEQLKNNADFSKRTKEEYTKDLEAFLESTGLTKDEAAKQAKNTVDSIIKELEKDDDKAKKAGSDKGQAHVVGLESTKAANKSTADKLGQIVTSGLSKTTDGGGGKSAGTMFGVGILSQKGRAQSAAKTIATSGVTGLRSVSAVSAGNDFVSGFRNSISRGSGAVWGAAWSLGKSALSALKSSVKTQSPSKETEQVGDWFTEGFTNKIDEGKRRAINSAKVLGKETLAALQNEVKNHKNTFGAMAMSLETNKEALKVEQEVKHSSLENKIFSLETVLEKLITVMSKSETETNEQNIVMNISVRNDSDINKIDEMLNNLAEKRRKAFGG